MKLLQTEAVILVSSYFFIIGLSNSVESRPCNLVKDSLCLKCSNDNECYDSGNCSWCCKCEAGKYSVKQCKHNEPKTTVCEICPNGTFTPVSNNLTQCYKSKSSESCDRLFNTMFQLGDSSHDNRCICNDGFYAENPELEGGCKPHLKCPPWFGVSRIGNATHDTECEYCGSGMCSKVTSSTEPCSPCTNTSDDTTQASTTVPFPPIAEKSPIQAAGIGVGVVIGAVVISIPFILLLWWLRRAKLRKRKKRKSRSQHKKSRTESRRPLVSGNPETEEDSAQPEESIPLRQMDSQRHESPKEVPKRTVDTMDPSVVHGKVRVHPEVANAALPDNTDVPPYKNAFRTNGYEVVYEPAFNEDCMFCATAYALINENQPNPSDDSVNERARNLRSKVVRHLQQNSDNYIHRVNQNWEEYINSVADGKRGDDVMIEVLSLVISRNIHVINTDGSRVDTGNGGDIFIGYITGYRDLYYVTLHRMDTEHNGTGSSRQRVEADPVAVPDFPTAREQLQTTSTSSREPQTDGPPMTVPTHQNTTEPTTSFQPESVDTNHPSSEQVSRLSPPPSMSSDLAQSSTSQPAGSLQQDQERHMQSNLEGSTRPGSPPREHSVNDQIDSSRSSSIASSDLPHGGAGETGQYQDESAEPLLPQQGTNREQTEPVSRDQESVRTSYNTADVSGLNTGEQSAMGPSTEQQSTAEQGPDNAEPSQAPVPTAVKLPLEEAVDRQHEQNLAVFKNESDRTELQRINVNPDVLHEALRNPDYLDAMCNYLNSKIRSGDLKELLRSLRLLNDLMIEDIEIEFRYDQREMRRKFLTKMCQEQGENLNPKIFLEKTLTYQMRKPYDDLCKGFLQHLRHVLENQPRR